MGMDVYGLHATSKAGSYFRNNCWWWRGLWDYCSHLPGTPIDDELGRMGHYNDGAGLDEDDARQLASLLRAALADGSAEAYEKSFYQQMEHLPDEPCLGCKGTGTEDKQSCSNCQGTGKVPHFLKYYKFSAENVKEFAEFLEDCGGFEIW